MCMRLEFWGDHLADLRKLKDESGLDWRENTFWLVVRTSSEYLLKRVLVKDRGSDII